MTESSTTSPATGAGTGRLPASTTTVLRVLVVAAFVVILNETLLINALPQLMDSLQISARAAQWLSTAFMLTLAVVIPTTGWLLQRVTTRQAMALAMGLFLAGTVIAVLAPAFTVLLLGRIVQACGTAIMMPLLMTTMMTLVPVQHRGRVMGNITLVIAVAPALGPAASGLVLEWLSWRWIFGLVFPVALVITLVGLRALRLVPDSDSSHRSKPALDALSVLLTAIGFGSLIYGLAEAGGEGTGVLPPSVAIGIGLIGLGLFTWRQLVLQRSGSPLLDLRSFTHRQFTVALLLMAVAFMSLMGVMILLVLYLQQVRGLSVLETGLLVMPGGLLMGLMGPRVGRWYDKVGPRPLVVPGATILLVSLIGLAAATAYAPWWVFLLCHLAVSLGLALLFTPSFTTGLSALPPQLYSYGSATLGALQQVAAAAGTALSVAVLSWREANLLASGMPQPEALDSGARWALLVAVGLGVITLALSLLLRDNPASGPDESPEDTPPQPEAESEWPVQVTD